jgi:amidohydrolase
MIDYLSEAKQLFDYTKFHRRDFHQYPELGFQEVRTASIVTDQLHQLGLEVSSGIAKTGIVALIEGNRPGPVIMLRFDMDALPITEETGQDYASKNPGIMHACGHDGHTAIGLSVAHILNNHRDMFPGTVKLVFQPAEEGLGGAEQMVRAGVLENPRPDFCLGLHLWNEKPTGWLCATPGAVMAASETFKIRIIGKGGHGASPQFAIDPVVAATQVINSIQTIVSRNISPLKSAVISVTSLRAGEAFNVIPQEAELKGTIRTFEPAIRDLVIYRFQTIIQGVSNALGCEVEIDIKSITPAVINDPSVTALVCEVMQSLLPEYDHDMATQTMGSEDMAFFQQEIPGCYFLIGSSNAEKNLDYPHHHPSFDFDEAILPQAVALTAASAIRLLHLR